MLVFAYIVGFILWIMLTWGLLAFTIEAFREKRIWNIIYGTIGFTSALFMLIYGFIKIIL